MEFTFFFFWLLGLQDLSSPVGIEPAPPALEGKVTGNSEGCYGEELVVPGNYRGHQWEAHETTASRAGLGGRGTTCLSVCQRFTHVPSHLNIPPTSFPISLLQVVTKPRFELPESLTVF